MLIYTSGTTGKPKGAVHVHGGFPIKAAQDLAHTFDLRRRRRPVLVHRPRLDDGAVGDLRVAAARRPARPVRGRARTIPGPDRLWALVARHRVTHLGLSPDGRPGADPARRRTRSGPTTCARLRVLGSTGEPWDPESWWWYFREVGGGRLPVVNYSGGTEVSGGIVGCNLLTPDQAGVVQRPVPGHRRRRRRRRRAGRSAARSASS